MSLKLTFQLQLDSDYHVGAGYGLGTEIDSALSRDADNVPVLRGTILNGLLRDGLWRLLQQEPMQRWQRCQESGLSQEEIEQRREELELSEAETKQRYCGQYTVGNADLCPICRLFGTPRTMKRWRIGSARPVGQERLAGTPYRLEETTSQRVMRVRVNPRTRRAAPRQLFSQEHGGQLAFTFTASCPAADEAALDEAALLVAAARFVRQLGRSRRRGQGECLISLIAVEGADVGDAPQELLLRRFEERWLKGEPQELAEPKRSRLERGRSEPAERKQVSFRVLARADEPLLIAQRPSAGNQFKSQPAITGKTLRGALAARAADCFDLKDKTTYDTFIALFLRDDVRFPTLYPLFRGKRHFYPAAPVPRDGFACKVYRKHPIQWGTQQKERVEKCVELECESPVKGIREEFFSLRELEPEHFKPEMRSEIHIRVEPETGRVRGGQLFDYVALDAGQYFIGELVCADEDAWGLLQEFTGLAEEKPIPLRLGKGTRRGYGQVTLWLERLNGKPPVWIQQHLGERVGEGASGFTLTLMTDAVVTDTWDRFATGFEDEWLARELGFEVKVEKGHDFAATRVVDGFNTQLRLPRWRDVVLAAGSSVRLRVVEQPKEGLLVALARVEQEGIGLRRNEGYGQVAFNHPVYKNCAGLTETSVEIREATDLAETAVSAEARFRQEWEQCLADQPWEKCRDDPFLALARWLDAHRHADISWLLAEVEMLGLPDRSLIDLIKSQGKEEGEDEYGDREKANRLVGTKGLALVKSLLERLQEQEEDRACWPLGIRMLADRLAEVAGQKEEGR